MKLGRASLLLSLVVVATQAQFDPTANDIHFVGDGCVNYYANDPDWTDLARNDDQSYYVNSGIDFDWFGDKFIPSDPALPQKTHLYINTNGNLSFRGGTFDRVPTDFDDFTSSIDMIAPFWADVDTNGKVVGDIHYKTVGDDKFAVVWNEVAEYENTNGTPDGIDKRNTFEVVLSDMNSPDPKICFCYCKMEWALADPFKGASQPIGPYPATIGINPNNDITAASFLLGRFGYDAPDATWNGFGTGGAPSPTEDAVNFNGVSHLDGRSYCFDANIIDNPPYGDLTLSVGETVGDCSKGATPDTSSQNPPAPTLALTQIGGCLTDASDISSGLDCVTGFTDCFDGAAILSSLGCLGDAAGDAVNDGNPTSSIEACLAPYATCIEGEIQKILDSLPDCLNTTVVNLGNCFHENGNTCNTTCTDADKPTSNPYAGVDTTTLALCTSFQTDIMDPTCGIVDCCEPCVDEVEAVMNCFVQNALDLKQAPPNANEDCLLECPASATRNRRELAGHTSDRLDSLPKIVFQPESLLKECGVSLGTTDGLNGLPAGIEELRTRITEGAFFTCLFDGLFSLAEQGAKEFALQNDANTPTAAPAGTGDVNPPDSAGTIMAYSWMFSMIMMMVVVSIGSG